MHLSNTIKKEVKRLTEEDLNICMRHTERIQILMALLPQALKVEEEQKKISEQLKKLGLKVESTKSQEEKCSSPHEKLRFAKQFIRFYRNENRKTHVGRNITVRKKTLSGGVSFEPILDKIELEVTLFALENPKEVFFKIDLEELLYKKLEDDPQGFQHPSVQALKEEKKKKCISKAIDNLYQIGILKRISVRAYQLELPGEEFLAFEKEQKGFVENHEKTRRLLYYLKKQNGKVSRRRKVGGFNFERIIDLVEREVVTILLQKGDNYLFDSSEIINYVFDKTEEHEVFKNIKERKKKECLWECMRNLKKSGVIEVSHKKGNLTYYKLVPLQKEFLNTLPMSEKEKEMLLDPYYKDFKMKINEEWDDLWKLDL